MCIIYDVFTWCGFRTIVLNDIRVTGAGAYSSHGYRETPGPASGRFSTTACRWAEGLTLWNSAPPLAAVNPRYLSARLLPGGTQWASPVLPLLLRWKALAGGCTGHRLEINIIYSTTAPRLEAESAGWGVEKTHVLGPSHRSRGHRPEGLTLPGSWLRAADWGQIAGGAGSAWALLP